MSAPNRRTRRPGGRSARVQAAVYAAVGELVSEGHRDSVTVPQVAERAGVNPTSVYRRWGSVDALMSCLRSVRPAAPTEFMPAPAGSYALVVTPSSRTVSRTESRTAAKLMPEATVQEVTATVSHPEPVVQAD